MISTSAGNAGAKISEIVEKVFFGGKDLTICNSCGVSVLKKKESSFYSRSRSCSGGSGDLFSAVNLAVAVVVNLEMAVAVLLCRHVVARMHTSTYMSHILRAIYFLAPFSCKYFQSLTQCVIQETRQSWTAVSLIVFGFI